VLRSRYAALPRQGAPVYGLCRRVYPFDVFIAAPEAVPNLVDLVEPLIDEALAALQQVPQARPSIGWAYPSKGGGGAFMWNAHKPPGP
jgi:hypothetical protein